MVIMKWFEELIIKSSREKYSDIHITGRQPRVFRKNGKLHIDRACRCNGKKIDAIVRNLSESTASGDAQKKTIC